MQQNAQPSTGPKIPEGNTAVRLNALKYGLRARSTLLPGGNPEDYMQLSDDLEADWQPKNRTERLHLETMATSQWLLARVAKSERRIYESNAFDEKQFALLALVAKQRAQLERSFRTAIEDLKQLQKERQSRPQPQPVQATQTPVEPSAKPPAPPPTYLVPEGTEAHPVFCSPIIPDRS